MTTYAPDGVEGLARHSYAWRSGMALIDNLKCDRGLKLHIADDGSAYSYEPLLEHATEFWESIATISNVNRRGIGASLNLALSRYVDNLWMYTTDDWLLTSELNLDGPISLLENHDYDLVRLGPIHPNLECVSRFNAGVGWWLDIHQHYGGFAFATRPFIAKRSMFDKIGPFDELQNSYETERLYAERVAKSTCKLAYWGAIDLAGPWSHVGDVNVGYKEIEVK